MYVYICMYTYVCIAYVYKIIICIQYIYILYIYIHHIYYIWYISYIMYINIIWYITYTYYTYYIHIIYRDLYNNIIIWYDITICFWPIFLEGPQRTSPPRGADQLADASAALARRSRHVPTPHHAAVGDQPTGEFTFSKCHGIVVNTIVIEWNFKWFNGIL